MPQTKSADDTADDNVRTGFSAGLDRVDDPGMAVAREQHAGGQRERMSPRDEIRPRACFIGEKKPAAVLAGCTGDRSGQEHAGGKSR